ncbi:hypothetical protein SELMODRAFT_404489 [Selaginella moellendorffii]|uniref:SAC domain-containing protein n=1 Tax=Selaginella moellendorffii TaxID=88036 RepID=D8QVH9_SELML|nr:hypothetical protein SELMODRAFT_404489 [Selaginella moellendorffii]
MAHRQPIREFYLPKVRCSFPLKNHPAYDKIAESVKAWALQCARPESKLQKQMLVNEKYALLACVMNPYGLKERVSDIGKFVAWYSIVDNCLDDASNTQFSMESRRIQQAHDFFTKLMKIMTSSNSSSSLASEENDLLLNSHATRFSFFFAELWKSFHRGMTVKQQERFADTVKQMCAANMKQLQRRGKNKERPVQSLEEYIQQRRASAAASSLVVLLEYALNMELPDSLLNNPKFQRLQMCAMDFGGWTNDIGSFRMEYMQGSYEHSLPWVICVNRGCSFQEAMFEACDMISAMNDEFMELYSEISEWPEVKELQLTPYLDTLGAHMVGNMHWTWSTERYHGRNWSPPKQYHGVVRMLPDATILDPTPAAALGILGASRGKSSKYTMYVAFILKEIGKIDERVLQQVARSRRLPVRRHKQTIVDKPLVAQLLGFLQRKAPQMLLEDGFSPILCTQPRRLAVVSVAKMVAEERGCDLGDEVGFHIGQLNKSSARSKIVFQTADLKRYKSYFSDLGEKVEKVAVSNLSSIVQQQLFSCTVKYLDHQGSKGILSLAYSECYAKSGMCNMIFTVYVVTYTSSDCQFFTTHQKKISHNNIGEVIQVQQGIIRTNCVGWLDRTNVTQLEPVRNQYAFSSQWLFGRKTLESQLQQLVWADHGDEISMQYALKGDFVGYGKRTVFGLIRDGFNALTRYFFNNFTDGIRQDAMNLVAGRYTVAENKPLPFKLNGLEALAISECHAFSIFRLPLL